MSNAASHDALAATLQRSLDGQTGGFEQRIRILESALESMGDEVAVVDEHGRFLVLNAAARRIYGRAPQDGSVDGWSGAYGIFLPDGVTRFPPHELPLARALLGESSDQVELFFRNEAHPDGIFVASTGRPLRDSNERLSRLVADQARRAESHQRVRADARHRSFQGVQRSLRPCRRRCRAQGVQCGARAGHPRCRCGLPVRGRGVHHSAARDVGVITASAGVAVYPDHGAHAEGLLHVADAALYAAKQAGRDRVEIAIQGSAAV